MIRIGTRVDNKNPKFQGFKPIPIIMRSHSEKWYPLSPYALKNEYGHLMENIWWLRQKNTYVFFSVLEGLSTSP